MDQLTGMEAQRRTGLHCQRFSVYDLNRVGVMLCKSNADIIKSVLNIVEVLCPLSFE